ncbi:MAG TPA: beta-L-arabinofuranosidase domain-containing protein [Terriglobales bacterium]|nr:beta-L-arabinofuranosidase domain-containing protein [Terriglobales bacterium]
MTSLSSISRRTFLRSASLSIAGAASYRLGIPSIASAAESYAPLQEFGYGDVVISSALHMRQLRDSQAILMNFSEDSLLKPFRQMAGQPAPGEDLGGWYIYKPDYDYHTDITGFAPAATFGQWVSALARSYAISGSSPLREKVLRLNRFYAQTISPGFYIKNRFPAYCYDKLVCGLIDSQKFAGDLDAFSILDHTTDVAMPHLPGKAVEQGTEWRPAKDISWTWDESYTISENLFLAYQRGAGKRYRDLAVQYLYNDYYNALANGQNALAGRHAYSHVNSLSSAMQAYLTLADGKYLSAAENAFAMLLAQSYATGGWGPDEKLRATDTPDLAASLGNSHSSFETPCGSYAHFKITRYLLRVTRDSRYGDSMERVMYNTILGAKPLQSDGHAFYYSDYNFAGSKIYSKWLWPCCSGTFPQIAADYYISAYFHDPAGIYLNLYIPSTLTWVHNGTPVSLTQKTSFPFDPLIEISLSLASSTRFKMNLRIPAWAEAASVSVNGKRVSSPVVPGSFVALDRKWKNGDRVELDLPLTTRLEPLDEQHPDLVALLCGPLVLFPVAPPVPKFTRAQLLAAKKSGSSRWQIETPSAPITLLPFTSIENEHYSTYFNLS